MKLGNVEIKSKLLLAPIAGFTDSPYRRIVRRHGAGLVMTELVSANGIIRNNKKTMEYLYFHETERPLGIQIFGNDPGVMARAASIVEKYSPDFIDINMGCPARKVCAGGGGAALMLDPDRVYAVASAVVGAVRLPVTAKIRLGWNNSHMNHNETVAALSESGITAVFVHGRTREQMYSGEADWEKITQIRETSAVPVIGNGDIRSYGDAFDKMALSGCAAVMIGRGALGNPWIFSGIEPDMSMIIAQIEEHLDLMLSFYGDYGIILMRKHLVKYIHDIRGASKIRSSLVHAKTRDDIHSALSHMSGLS